MAKRIAKANLKANQDESVLSIRERDLIILQATPHVSLSVLEDMVLQGFSSAHELPKTGDDWLAFSASQRAHWAGKTLWIGLSESVPLELVDGLQAHLESAGLLVEREMGRALHNGMNPFARMSGAELEVLVPQPLVRTPGRKVNRGGIKANVRGYFVKR
ncbi:MAG: hypothetical protein Q8L14_12750 [Myxococcales bacterium]|nr:hypothetical protein [Myxococcales bacterium]